MSSAQAAGSHKYTSEAVSLLSIFRLLLWRRALHSCKQDGRKDESAKLIHLRLCGQAKTNGRVFYESTANNIRTDGVLFRPIEKRENSHIDEVEGAEVVGGGSLSLGRNTSERSDKWGRRPNSVQANALVKQFCPNQTNIDNFTLSSSQFTRSSVCLSVSLSVCFSVSLYL